MSDARDTAPHDEPHEGPIKTPKQLVWAVVFSFVVPIIGIILLANFVATGNKQAAGTEALEAEIASLEAEAAQLGQEIEQLTGEAGPD